MKKVLILGCPGAGKSTFARKLRDKTGLPLYYLDMIWHKPDRTTITKQEFDAKLSEIIKQEEWIIDGNYGRTLEMRFEECDTVFFLDLPQMCVLRARKGVLEVKEKICHGRKKNCQQNLEILLSIFQGMKYRKSMRC